MINHPRCSKLAEHGGRITETDGRRTVEMVNPNDNARRRFQYRRSDDGLERRILRDTGSHSHGAWESMTIDEIGSMLANRGEYHPILDFDL